MVDTGEQRPFRRTRRVGWVGRVGAMILAALTWIGQPAWAAGEANETAGAGDMRDAQPRDVLLLHRLPPENDAWFDSGVLLRELLRQSLLLAAREELGILTRDAVLGEPAPPGARAIGLKADVKRGERCRLTLTATLDGREGQLRIADMPWPGGNPVTDWRNLLAQCEIHARTHMVTALNRAGFRGRGKGASEQREIPADLAAKLRAMDLVSQFEAVRAAHAAMDEQGSSPAMLSVVVRGYANLAITSGQFWSPMHKSFAARSLLYAQRWVATEPDRPEPLWHRAYAWSAAGVPRAAKEDLDAAATLAGGMDIEEPTWARLLRLAADSDYQALTDAAAEGGEYAGLAGVLALDSVYLHAGQSLTVSTGLAAHTAAPRCVWITDVLAEAGGVRLGHWATLAGPEILVALMRERLATLDGLPPTARDQLPDDPELYRRAATRHQIAQALIDAAAEPDIDDASLSWAVLGRLLDEANVLQLARRMHFVAEMLGMGREHCEELARYMLPAVEHHPFAVYFTSYAQPMPADREQLAAAFAAIDAPDIGYSVRLAFTRADALKLASSIAALRDRRNWNTDLVERDMAALINLYTNADHKRWGLERLRAVAPRRPLTLAHTLILEPDTVEADLDRWIEQYADHPAVVRALVARLRNLDRLDDAIVLLERYLELAPADWPIDQLAYIYHLRGDEQMRYATIKRRLDYPDYGLSHQATQARLARWHMDRGEFEQALPWAERAADSGAANAMQTLAACYEALNRMDEAEAMIRRMAHRYDTSVIDWYFWCQRTGHGDVEAAEALAAEALDALRRGQGAAGLYREDAVTLAIYEHDDAAAARLAEQLFDHPHQIRLGLMAAICHNQAGDIDQRNTMIARLVETSQQQGWQGCVDFFEAVRAAWDGRADALSADNLDELVRGTGGSMHYWARMMLADALHDLGRDEEAIAQLRLILTTDSVGWIGYHWAWRVAREWGLDPVAVRGWSQPPPPRQAQPFEDDAPTTSEELTDSP